MSSPFQYSRRFPSNFSAFPRWKMVFWLIIESDPKAAKADCIPCCCHKNLDSTGYGEDTKAQRTRSAPTLIGVTAAFVGCWRTAAFAATLALNSACPASSTTCQADAEPASEPGSKPGSFRRLLSTANSRTDGMQPSRSWLPPRPLPVVLLRRT